MSVTATFYDQLLAIGFNILTMWITATVIMLTYSIRSNKAEFNLRCWLKTNTDRFLGGASLIVGVSVLMVISPDINTLLQLIGFNADKTPIALGAAIGALLIAGVSGNPAAKPKPINTEDNL